MDIDNFRSFMLGDEKGYPFERMEMSKQFALFLRRDAARILQRYPAVVMVHEGADDAFFMGPIGELLDFSLALHDHYLQYTAGQISFSAGICLYDVATEHFSAGAARAQALMDYGKTIEGKDGIVVNERGYFLKWSDFARALETIKAGID